MPQLEAWEQVFVSDDAFFETTHGDLGCIACHGGDGEAEDMEAAHTGVVRDPDSIDTCGSCHNETTTTDAMSRRWGVRSRAWAGVMAGLSCTSLERS